MALTVDVVIPVSNHWALTQSCLKHLAKQTRSHRVIVGDNGSTDGTPENLAADWPDVHVLRTEAPQPFAVVCNAGAKAGDGDVIVLLNNDVDCEPDFLEQIVAPLETDPNLSDVASLCIRPNGREIDSVGITCDATLSAFARLQGEPIECADSPTPVLTGAAGTAGAYRRTAWKQVGGLDETFPAYQEDFELALRLRAAGWTTTAAPAARCNHLGSASYVARSARSRENGGFGRGYVLRRYGAVTPRAALIEAVVVLGDAVTTRDLAAARGRVRGWRAARGLPPRTKPQHAIDDTLTLRDALALRRGRAERGAGEGAQVRAGAAPGAPAPAGSGAAPGEATPRGACAAPGDGAPLRAGAAPPTVTPVPDALTCPACGAGLAGAPRLHGRDRMLATPGEFDVAICPTCASGTTVPLLEPEQVAALYPDAYGPYAETDCGLVQTISKLIRATQGRLALNRFPLDAIASRPPGRGLDVGCGRGDLAAEFVDRGWTMVGVEPSPNACEAARVRGVDARVGTIATVALEPNTYDMIVFQHSLEHTLDPRGDLETVLAALAPGGMLAVTVPNFGSWQARRFKDRWFHLDLPRHRTHFTRDGLATVATDAGLEVQDVRTSTSTVGLPATIQYQLAGRCLFPSGLKLRVAAGLCVLVLPLARLLDRGDGDQLHLFARRPPF